MRGPTEQLKPTDRRHCNKDIQTNRYTKAYNHNHRQVHTLTNTNTERYKHGQTQTRTDTDTDKYINTDRYTIIHVCRRHNNKQTVGRMQAKRETDTNRKTNIQRNRDNGKQTDWTIERRETKRLRD